MPSIIKNNTPKMTIPKNNTQTSVSKAARIETALDKSVNKTPSAPNLSIPRNTANQTTSKKSPPPLNQTTETKTPSFQEITNPGSTQVKKALPQKLQSKLDKTAEITKTTQSDNSSYTESKRQSPVFKRDTTAWMNIDGTLGSTRNRPIGKKYEWESYTDADGNQVDGMWAWWDDNSKRYKAVSSFAQSDKWQDDKSMRGYMQEAANLYYDYDEMVGYMGGVIRDMEKTLKTTTYESEAARKADEAYIASMKTNLDGAKALRDSSKKLYDYMAGQNDRMSAYDDSHVKDASDSKSYSETYKSDEYGTIPGGRTPEDWDIVIESLNSELDRIPNTQRFAGDRAEKERQLSIAEYARGKASEEKAQIEKDNLGLLLGREYYNVHDSKGWKSIETDLQRQLDAIPETETEERKSIQNRLDYVHDFVKAGTYKDFYDQWQNASDEDLIKRIIELGADPEKTEDIAKPVKDTSKSTDDQIKELQSKLYKLDSTSQEYLDTAKQIKELQATSEAEKAKAEEEKAKAETPVEKTPAEIRAEQEEAERKQLELDAISYIRDVRLMTGSAKSIADFKKENPGATTDDWIKSVQDNADQKETDLINAQNAAGDAREAINQLRYRLDFALREAYAEGREVTLDDIKTDDLDLHGIEIDLDNLDKTERELYALVDKDVEAARMALSYARQQKAWADAYSEFDMTQQPDYEDKVKEGWKMMGSTEDLKNLLQEVRDIVISGNGYAMERPYPYLYALADTNDNISEDVIEDIVDAYESSYRSDEGKEEAANMLRKLIPNATDEQINKWLDPTPAIINNDYLATQRLTDYGFSEEDAKSMINKLKVRGEDENILDALTPFVVDDGKMSFSEMMEEVWKPTASHGIEKGEFSAEQLGNYYYILATEGLSAATDYALKVNNQLTSEYRDEMRKKMNLLNDYRSDNATGFEKGLQYVATPWVTGLMNLTGIVDTFKYADQVGHLGNSILSEAPSISEASEWITQDVNRQLTRDGASQIVQFFYNAYGSAVQSYEAMMVGGSIAKMLGIGESTVLNIGLKKGLNAHELITSAFTDLAFFGSASSSRYRELIDRGVEPEKAMNSAIISGICEAAFEHISIEALYHAKDVADFTGIGDVIMSTIIGSGIEGSEEVCTELANFIFDQIVLGVESDFAQSIDAYKAQGLTTGEARSKAIKDFAAKVGEAGAAGFVSGGMSIGPRTGISYVQERYSVKDYNKARGSTYLDHTYADGKNGGQALGEFISNYDFFKEKSSGDYSGTQHEMFDTIKDIASRASKGIASAEEIGRMVSLADSLDPKIIDDFMQTNKDYAWQTDPGRVLRVARNDLNAFLGVDRANAYIEAIGKNPDAFVVDDFAKGFLEAGTSMNDADIADIELFLQQAVTGNGQLSPEAIAEEVKKWNDQKANLYILEFLSNAQSKGNEQAKTAGQTEEGVTGNPFQFVIDESLNRKVLGIESTEELQTALITGLTNTWNRAKQVASDFRAMNLSFNKLQNAVADVLRKDARDTAEAVTEEKESGETGTNISDFRDDGDSVTFRGKKFNRKEYVASIMEGKDPFSGEEVGKTTAEEANNSFDTLLERASDESFGKSEDMSAEMVNFDLAKRTPKGKTSPVGTAEVETKEETWEKTKPVIPKKERKTGTGRRAKAEMEADKAAGGEPKRTTPKKNIPKKKTTTEIATAKAETKADTETGSEKSVSETMNKIMDRVLEEFASEDNTEEKAKAPETTETPKEELTGVELALAQKAEPEALEREFAMESAEEAPTAEELREQDIESDSAEEFKGPSGATERSWDDSFQLGGESLNRADFVASYMSGTDPMTGEETYPLSQSEANAVFDSTYSYAMSNGGSIKTDGRFSADTGTATPVATDVQQMAVENELNTLESILENKRTSGEEISGDLIAKIDYARKRVENALGKSITKLGSDVESRRKELNGQLKAIDNRMDQIRQYIKNKAIGSLIFNQELDTLKAKRRDVEAQLTSLNNAVAAYTSAVEKLDDWRNRMYASDYYTILGGFTYDGRTDTDRSSGRTDGVGDTGSSRSTVVTSTGRTGTTEGAVSEAKGRTASSVEQVLSQAGLNFKGTIALDTSSVTPRDIANDKSLPKNVRAAILHCMRNGVSRVIITDGTLTNEQGQNIGAYSLHNTENGIDRSIFIVNKQAKIPMFQNILHEYVHHMLGRLAPENRKRFLQSAMKTLFSGRQDLFEAVYNTYLDDYVKAYNLTLDADGKLDAENALDIYEEMTADMYAKIPRFAGDEEVAVAMAPFFDDMRGRLDRLMELSGLEDYSRDKWVGEEHRQRSVLNIENFTGESSPFGGAVEGKAVSPEVADETGMLVDELAIPDSADGQPEIMNVSGDRKLSGKASVSPEYEATPKQSTKVNNSSVTKKTLMDKKGNLINRTVREVRDEAFHKNKEFMTEQGEAGIKKFNSFLDKVADWLTNTAAQKFRYLNFEDINNATLKVDPVSNQLILTSMVKNGDYAVNIDFGTICERRQALQTIMNELLEGASYDENGIKTVQLNAKSIHKINEALRDAGINTQCLICFVETKRYNQTKQFAEFTELWNNEVKKYTDSNEFFKFRDGVKELTEEQIEARRKALDGYSGYGKGVNTEKAVADMVKRLAKYSPDDLKLLDINDIASSKGRTSISQSFPDLDGLIKKKGGSAAPKPVYGYIPYNGEIEGMYKQKRKDEKEEQAHQRLRDYMKSIAGVRSQSFSDFIITHVFDHLQKTGGMAAMGFPGHTYTKVLARAELFGLTGEKINMSLLFDINPNVNSWYAGLNEETQDIDFSEDSGRLGVENARNRPYNFSDYQARMEEKTEWVQSFPYKDAVRIQNTPVYSKNTGTIGVSHSYWHTMWMLADPEIRQVIGYHSSSYPGEIKNITHLNMSTDYTDVQNNVKIVGIARPNYEMPDGTPSYATEPSNAKKLSGEAKRIALAEDEVQKIFGEYANGASVDLSKMLKDAVADKNNRGKSKGQIASEVMQNFLTTLNDNGLTLITTKAEAGHGSFKLYDDVEQTQNPYETMDNYIAYNLTKGNLPAFYEFSSDPNYYKLIFDFNMFDRLSYNPETGLYETYAPQEAVKVLDENGELLFPNKGDIIDMLDHYATQYDNEQHHVYDFINDESNMDYVREVTGVKASVDTVIDQEYMAAVESDDEAKAQQLVNEAAVKSGVITNERGKPLHLYHGTPHFGRTTFEKGFLFTTSNPSAAASYVKEGQWGRTRKISEAYIPDDGTDETLLKNMKNIDGHPMHPVTEEIRKGIIDKIKGVAEELSAKIMDVWSGPAVDVLGRIASRNGYETVNEWYKDDPDAALSNATSWVLNLAESVNGYVEDLADPEYRSPYVKEIQESVDYYNKNYDELRKFLVDNWNEIKGTDAEPLARFIRGYDLGDLAIDVEMSLLRSMQEPSYQYDEGGGIRTREQLESFIEQSRDAGSYDLYGYAGDNPLVVDAANHFWTSIPTDAFGELKYYSTDTIAEKAKEAGYTSVIIKNVIDPGTGLPSNVPIDDYIFFNSSDVKSADAVTYDDDGNVIPLSERFNRDKNDIRFSVDSDGIELSRQQQNYFADSKVRDSHGNLIPLYHGGSTLGYTVIDFSKTDDGISYFMTSSPYVAASYGGSDEVRSLMRDKEENSQSVYDGYELLQKHPISMTDEELARGYELASKVLDGKDITGEVSVVPFEKALNDIDTDLRKRFKVATDYYNDDIDHEQLKNAIYAGYYEEIEKNLADISDIINSGRELSSKDLATLRSKLRLALGAMFNARTEDKLIYLQLSQLYDLSDDLYHTAGDLLNIKEDDSKRSVFITPDGDMVTYTQFELTAGGRILQANSRLDVEMLDKTSGVLKVYANLTNPYVIDAEGESWRHIRAPEEVVNYLKSINEPQLHFFSGRGDLLKTRGVARYAKDHGYDGVIFENLVDMGGDPDFDDDTESTVVIAFEQNQVKDADNLNPTNDVDMRYSIDNLPDGTQYVWIDSNIVAEAKKNNQNVPNYVQSYIEQVFEKTGVPIATTPDGHMVYAEEAKRTPKSRYGLGKEFTHSTANKRLGKNLAEKKLRSATNLAELVAIAQNATTESTRHTENKDAVSTVRYTSTFAFPVWNPGRTKLENVRAYDCELVMNLGSDGKYYLYDVPVIKENTASAIAILNEKQGAATNAAGQYGVSAKSIANTEQKVNTQNSAQDRASVDKVAVQAFTNIMESDNPWFENFFEQHPDMNFPKQYGLSFANGTKQNKVKRDFTKFVKALPTEVQSKLLDRNMMDKYTGAGATNLPWYVDKDWIQLYGGDAFIEILKNELNKETIQGLTDSEIDKFRPDLVNAISAINDRKNGKLDSDTLKESLNSLRWTYKNNPSLNYLTRLANASTAAEKTAIRKEFEKMLSGIDNDRALWYMQSYSKFATPAYVSDNDAQTKLEGSAQKLFSNIIDARRNELALASGQNSVVGMETREYDISEIRSMFNELNKDESVKALADKVFPVVERLGLTIRGVPAKRTGSRVAGHAFGSIVEYNVPYFNNPQWTDQKKASTLLHELIHSATSYAINAYNHPAGNRKLTANMREAVKTINSIYYAIEGDSSFEGMYGVKNPGEMLAELANPQFREKLEKKSLWTRLVDAIKQFFGIDTHNALDAASVGLDYLLDNFDYNAYLADVYMANDALHDFDYTTTAKATSAVNQMSEGSFSIDSPIDVFGDPVSLDTSVVTNATPSALSDHVFYADGNAYVQTDDGQTVVINNVTGDSPEAKYINTLETINNADRTTEKPYTIPVATRNADDGYNLREQNAGLRRGSEEVSEEYQEESSGRTGSISERNEQGEPQGTEQESVKASLDFSKIPNIEFLNDDGEVVTSSNLYPIGSFQREVLLDIASNNLAGLERTINALWSNPPSEEVVSSIRDQIQINNSLTDTEKKNLQRQLDERIAEYGMQPYAHKDKKRADKREDVHLPLQINDTTRTRKFVQTAARNASRKEFSDQALLAALREDISSYEPISDAKARDYAQSMLDKQGYTRCMAIIKSKVESNEKVTKYDIALAEMLMKAAELEGNYTDALQLVADIAIIGTNAGQVVQAMSMVKKLTPRGQLYYMQTLVNRLNRTYEKAINDPKNKMNKIIIPDANAKAVLTAQTQEEFDDAVKDLKQAIANQIPATWADKWNSWRYLAMLGNPRTHVRNLFGNGMFAPAVFVKDLIARELETHTNLVDPEKRSRLAGATFNKNSAYMRFAEENFEVMKDILSGEATDNKYTNLNEIMKLRKIWSEGPIGKFMKGASELNSKLLEKEDLIFLKMYYERAFAEFLQARGVTEAELDSTWGTTKETKGIMYEAQAWALREAQRNTYRDANAIATTLNQLKRKNPASYVLLEGLVPFTKTPLNILNRGIEYSPIGLIQSIVTLSRDLRSGQFTTSEAIDRLAAGMTGTFGLTLLGFILAQFGLLRGMGPDDDKEREFDTLQGHQNWSIEIGDVSYTIDWMAPAALPLFVGCSIHDMLQGDLNAFTVWDIGTALSRIAEPLTALSMLDGLNSTLNSIATAQENSSLSTLAGSMLMSYVSQGMPTIFGQIARSIDSDRRTTYVDKNSTVPAALQKFIQKSIQAKVPGWESQRMAYVDEWGRTDSPDTALQTLWKVFENFVSPGYGNKIVSTSVDDELRRLYEVTKDNAVLPNKGAKYLTNEGERKDYTAKEYEEFSKVRGATAFNLLTEIFATSEYQEMDDENKKKIIDSVYSYADSVAKQEILPEMEMKAGWMDTAKAIGPADYILIKSNIDDSKTNEKLFSYLASNPRLNESQIATIISQKYAAPDEVKSVSSNGYIYSLTEEDEDAMSDIFAEVVNERLSELRKDPAYLNADSKEQGRLINDLYSQAREDTKTLYGSVLDGSGRAMELGKASSVGKEAFQMVLDVDGGTAQQAGWLSDMYSADKSIKNPLHSGFDLSLDNAQRRELKQEFANAWNAAYKELVNSKEFKSAPSRAYKNNMIADKFNAISQQVEDAYAAKVYRSGKYTEELGKSGSYTWGDAYSIATQNMKSSEEQAKWLAQKYSTGSKIDNPDRSAYVITLTGAQQAEIKEDFTKEFIPRYNALVSSSGWNNLSEEQRQARVNDLQKKVTADVETAYARKIIDRGYYSEELSTSASYAKYYTMLSTEKLTDKQRIQLLKDKYEGGTISNPEAKEYRIQVYNKFIDDNYSKYVKNGTAAEFEKLHSAASTASGNAVKKKYNIKKLGDVPDLEYPSDGGVTYTGYTGSTATRPIIPVANTTKPKTTQQSGLAAQYGVIPRK